MLLWNPTTGATVRTITPGIQSVTTAAFSTVNGRLLVAGSERVVRIFDTNSFRELHALSGHTDRVMSADFAPDSSDCVFSCCGDRTVRQWNAGLLARTLLVHSKPLDLAVLTACVASLREMPFARAVRTLVYLLSLVLPAHPRTRIDSQMHSFSVILCV